ncbi:MAG: hypothetical protein LC775_15070 [Acidobacteria bacterium]|nr:hypothetical protein [Acidobacteriota bacterium]
MSITSRGAKSTDALNGARSIVIAHLQVFLVVGPGVRQELRQSLSVLKHPALSA